MLSLLSLLRQRLRDEVQHFEQAQLRLIENEVRSIDEYQADIRKTRDDIRNVLNSQP